MPGEEPGMIVRPPSCAPMQASPPARRWGAGEQARLCALCASAV